MKKNLVMILTLSFLSGCGKTKIEQLEQENAILRHELDSIKDSIEKNARFVREKYIQARKQGQVAMDSVIIAKNLKVLMVYISCDNPASEQDIEESIDALEGNLKDFGIEIYKLPGIYPEEYACGYELAQGRRREKIQGVMAAKDLALLIEEFYGISLSKRD